MLNVLSVLTPDVSLHRCFPTGAPTVQLVLGSSLTSVLPVFIHIKSCITDCLLPIFLNSLWFCSFLFVPCLALLGKANPFKSGILLPVSHSQLFMKNKDVRDGPATKLQTPPGTGMDPS